VKFRPDLGDLDDDYGQDDLKIRLLGLLTAY